MTDINKKEKMSAAELCYRLFVIFLAVGFSALIIISLITARSVVGNEPAVKRAAAVLSSIFFALLIMALLTLVLCWISMKKTSAANLMLSTLLMTVSCIFLLLNVKWVYTVYAYGSGNGSFVRKQIGKTVESYYAFLDSVHFRWLLMGFAAAFIIILGAVSFFHLRRSHRKGR